MAKKQTQSKHNNKKKLYGFITLGVLLLIAASFGYGAYSDYRDAQLDKADRERFETVREKVATLHNRLQKIAAQGEEWEMKTFCSQGSVKFQEPLKTCFVKTGLAVEVATDTQAEALISKYQAVFREASDLFILRKQYTPDPVSFPTNLENGLYTGGYRERETNMVCSGSFEIDDHFNERAEADFQERILGMHFSCNSGARELHYQER